MYKFACKDVGVDCSFVAMAETVDEVKDKAFAHAGVVHADIMSSLTEVQKVELTNKVITSIQRQ